MAANATLGIIGLILVTASLQYTSPTRLTRVLSDTINSLENVYVAVVYTGLLSIIPADEVDIVVSMYIVLNHLMPVANVEVLSHGGQYIVLCDFGAARPRARLDLVLLLNPGALAFRSTSLWARLERDEAKIEGAQVANVKNQMLDFIEPVNCGNIQWGWGILLIDNFLGWKTARAMAAMEAHQEECDS
ncbi:hypothetical protein B0H16DRAFT_1476929 [Mycena metata]|uniref:Uncharacterized protein n=1 Tax=Mycena metata TaxID=1033252 RepID=A0AAD7HA58_9AGAR|nr:hypothetical protein B0H16DRAFT_1476929 [Mycena metata]